MEKNLQTNFESVGKLMLASVLSKLYVEVRKTDGEHYNKTASLNSIRAGIKICNQVSQNKVALIKSST